MTTARPHGLRSAALAAALLLGALLLGAAPASAAGAVPPPGEPLGVTPASGNLDVIPTLTTAGPCPASTTHAYAVVYGGALPDDGQVLRDTARSGLSTTTAFSTEASRTWRDLFAAAGATATDAEHVVELVCTDELGRKLGRSTAIVRVTATTYEAPGGPQPSDATLAAGAPPADPTDLAGLDPQAVADLLQGTAATEPEPEPAAAGAAPPADPQGPVAQFGSAPVASESPAGGSTGSLVAVALLGAGLTAAACLGIPALRRRRAPAPALTGRTAP